ncbi:MAG: hypothetical protein ABIP49_01225 [Lysobacterales bacterium]
MNVLSWIGAAVLFIGTAACSTNGSASGAGSAAGSEADSGEFRQGPSLFAIAISADAIVIGKIIATQRDGFEIRLLEKVHGDATGAVIQVENSAFENTDPRWAPYATGQTLVLFLRRPHTKHARWRVLGMSGEGELPTDAAFTYLTGHFVEGLPVERYRTMGASITSQRIARADLIDAIRGLFECFTAHGKAVPVQVCDRAALSRYAARSPLHAQLARANK